MTAPKPEPALTDEEWANHTAEREDGDWRFVADLPPDGGGALRIEDADTEDGGVLVILPEHIPAVIALANAALPDDDPRKITREWTHNLRTLADFLEQLSVTESANLIAWEDRGRAAIYLREYAAALESYLPPEKP